MPIWQYLKETQERLGLPGCTIAVQICAGKMLLHNRSIKHSLCQTRHASDLQALQLPALSVEPRVVDRRDPPGPYLPICPLSCLRPKSILRTCTASWRRYQSRNGWSSHTDTCFECICASHRCQVCAPRMRLWSRASSMILISI